MSIEIKRMVVKTSVRAEAPPEHPDPLDLADDLDSLKQRIVDELKEEMKTMLDLRGDR